MRINDYLDNLYRYPQEFAAIDGDPALGVDDVILYWDALTPAQRKEKKHAVEVMLSSAISEAGGVNARRFSYSSPTLPLEDLVKLLPPGRLSAGYHGETDPLGVNVPRNEAEAFLGLLVSEDAFEAATLIAKAHSVGPTLVELASKMQPTIRNVGWLWRIISESQDQTLIDAFVKKALRLEEHEWKNARGDFPAPLYPKQELALLAATLAKMPTTEAAARMRLAVPRLTEEDITAARVFPSLQAAADFAEARSLSGPRARTSRWKQIRLKTESTLRSSRPSVIWKHKCPSTSAR